MKIVCDACSAKYSIADEKVRGKVFKIRCKKCSNIIVVRGAVSESADAAAPQYKETKVFDYAGTQRADSAAEVSESAVWHLVIDQEQVGPMTVEEVRDRFHRGEVDGEGFVWREGFGDWERLADVQELAAIVGSGHADDGGLGGLFGGGAGEPYDEARAAQNDPTDLFAARGAAEDAGAVDLFSGTGLTATSVDATGADTDALFAGDGGGAGAATASSTGKPVVSSLTAQRNENSVLFSLNNLAALASDAPRSVPLSSPSPAASSSSSMPATGGSGTSPQSEGSGLIDIRSMAQVYLGETKSPTSRPVGSGSVDDLPVFSQSSFDSASPVLLPTVQPAVNNRLLFALVGLIGVLVITAVVLVLVVLKGGSDKPPVVAVDTAGGAGKAPAPAAAAPPSAASPAEPAAAAGAGAPASAGGTAGGAGDAPAATTPAGSDPSSDEPAGGDEDEPAAAAKSGSRSDRDRDRDRGRDKKDRDRGRDKDRGRDRRADRRSDVSSRDKEPKVVSTAPPPDPTATSGCDEVTCLVEPDKPCCKRLGRKSSGGGSSSRSVDTSLPEQPSRGDVAAGIGDVKGRVTACGSRAPGGGKVTVKIKISPTGGVASASASGGSAALNGCVESAVRGAKFPRSQFGVSVNYPFIF